MEGFGTRQVVIADHRQTAAPPGILAPAPAQAGVDIIGPVHEHGARVQPVAHRRRPVRIADLAEHLGVSLRSLNRRFRKATGETPLEYLQRTRMEVAQSLLRETNLGAAFAGTSSALRFTQTDGIPSSVVGITS